MKKCKSYKGFIIKKHPMGKKILGICLFGVILKKRHMRIKMIIII